MAAPLTLGNSFAYAQSSLSDTKSSSLHDSLCEAIEDGDIAAISSFLDSGGSPNLQDSDGFSLLMYAAIFGQEEIVRKLIQAGADTTLQENTLRYTALHFALEKNEIEVSKLLIEEGKSINILGVDSISPLHLAAASLSPELVKALIAKGADLNKLAGIEGVTALFPCIESAAQSVLPKDKEALEIVRTLVEAGVEVDARLTEAGSRFRAIHYAAMFGFPDIVQFLLRSGAAKDKVAGEMFSPLCAATLYPMLFEAGYSEKIKKLSFQYAKEGKLGTAAQSWSEEELEQYVDELLLAIKSRIDKGVCDSIRILIANGADVNAGFSTGEGKTLTPLGQAIAANNPKMVKILLAAGADTSFIRNDKSLLDKAKKRNVKSEIIKLLEEATAE